MKKFLHVFLLTVFCIALCPNAFAGRCEPVDCASTRFFYYDVLNVNISEGGAWNEYDFKHGKCFYCDDSDAGSNTCLDDDYVGQKNSDGLVKKIFKCNTGGRDTFDLQTIRDICTRSPIQFVASELKFENNMIADGDDYVCGYSFDDGVTYNYSGAEGVSSQMSGARMCVYCKCKEEGKVWNSDKKKCMEDEAARDRCEKDNSDGQSSFGQWDNTRNTCLCGKADRTDEKGEGQEYKEAGKECQCEGTKKWDGTNCIEPGSDGDSGGGATETNPEQAACEKRGSHGRWEDNTCKCDKENQTEGVFGKTCACITDHKYDESGNCVPDEEKVCKKYGGEWINGTCRCNYNDHLVPVAPDGEKNLRCKCDDAQLYMDKAGTGTDSHNPLKCVADDKQRCKYTGGVWENNDCRCTGEGAARNLRHKLDKAEKWCECKDPDTYEYHFDKQQGCVLNGAGIDLNRLKDECEGENSWGKWDDNARVCECKAANMSPDFTHTRCVCKSAMYKVDATSKSCKEIDCSVQQKIYDALRGKFNVALEGEKNSCRCYCTVTGETLVADATATDTMGYICKQIVPAVKPVTPEKTPAQIQAEQEQARKQQLAAQQLNDVRGTLRSIEGGLKQSHWKDAQGNFNTARLASDSIAGVVLGTAGGLITSNVIKKNQVSGGFEKLQCTIGGQVVAGWGDLFKVWGR